MTSRTYALILSSVGILLFLAVACANVIVDPEFVFATKLLTRTGSGNEGLQFAGVTLDPATREVHRGDRRLQLTRTEFNLLELFMRNPRQVLTRSQIYERVWGYDFGATSNALWVYIGYLRRKLEEGGEPRLLHTVRGVGYALREEP